MILYELLGEKSMVQDLNFVQLSQMPEDDRNLIKLHGLRAYIDQFNKKAVRKSQSCLQFNPILQTANRLNTTFEKHKIPMKKIIILALLILSTYNVHAQTLLTGKVIGVKDGDTVEVLDDQNKTTILRLAEVDCPEKKQPYGNAAKQFTSNAVYRKNVSYIITNKDRYGRSVAKLYYKSKYLSAEIIKNGMGWHYKKHSRSKELAVLEQKARAKKIGLWADINPIYPSEWRKERKKKNYR